MLVMSRRSITSCEVLEPNSCNQVIPGKAPVILALAVLSSAATIANAGDMSESKTVYYCSSKQVAVVFLSRGWRWWQYGGGGGGAGQRRRGRGSSSLRGEARNICLMSLVRRDRRFEARIRWRCRKIRTTNEPLCGQAGRLGFHEVVALRPKSFK